MNATVSKSLSKSYSNLSICENILKKKHFFKKNNQVYTLYLIYEVGALRCAGDFLVFFFFCNSAYSLKY